MFQSFRLSMTWLHTWFGLVLGYVLMVAFFFGALSVFDREIDRWAIPETRFEPQRMPSFDTMLAPIFKTHRAGGRRARGGTRARRRPAARRHAGDELGRLHHAPRSGAVAVRRVRDHQQPEGPRRSRAWPRDDRPALGQGAAARPAQGRQRASSIRCTSACTSPGRTSATGSSALAALVMMAALVSGVVMHRKIFRELFTFRPKKHTQRSALDLHNLTGVVALPFHFVFALSGLTIFASIYLPVSETMLKPLAQQHEMARSRGQGPGVQARRRGGADGLGRCDGARGQAPLGRARHARRGGLPDGQPRRRRQQLRQHLSRRQRPCHVGRAGGALRGAHRPRDPRGSAAGAAPRR